MYSARSPCVNLGFSTNLTLGAQGLFPCASFLGIQSGACAGVVLNASGEVNVLLRRIAGIGAFIALFFSFFLTPAVDTARAEEVPLQCDAGVNAEPSRPRYISLVIDDSGSMFARGDTPLDRWSMAKYSLEVFAVMLGVEDRLDVYRMSDFGAAAATGLPQLRLSGQEPASSRVAKVHEMQLQGGGTPYAPVRQAMTELAAAEAPDKWLVVLSDGAFTDRETPEVVSDFHGFIAANSDEDVRVRIAFMSIGDEAPQIAQDAAGGLYSAHAATSAHVLELMTDFSNRIFERSVLAQSAPNLLTTDIDLDELLVFAQGPEVAVGSLTSSAAVVAPDSEVKVSWAENQRALYSATTVEAVPNKDLNGAFAAFTGVTAGTWGLEAGGARTVDLFYRPKVRFGVQLRDEQGQVVDADRIVGGTYRLDYGFMNSRCEFITSSLLGEVDYTARVLHEGSVIADNFASGDQITLERGQVVLEIGASYLDGNTSEAKVGLQILRPPADGGFSVEAPTYDVTDLGDDGPPAPPLRLEYSQLHEGERVPFSPEEWATLDASAIRVTSDSNLEFDVEISDEVGVILVTPRAPGGDAYAADVGPISLHVEATHIYDEQMNNAAADLSFDVTDNLSTWDRILNWLATQGWKWAIGLAGLVLLLGYLFKKRFSRRIKSKPSIRFMPTSPRERQRQGTGKFHVNGFRKLLPFVPDKATLSYTLPGSTGFRAMKLKASKGKSMEVLNWKDLAAKNVQINGMRIDKEAKRPPKLGVSSVITAIDNQGRYESSPNA